MKTFVLLFTILVFISSLKSQSQADEFYAAGYFKEASIIFEKDLEKGKGDLKLLKLKLADSYYHMNEFDKSLKLYKVLYSNEDKDSITILRLAELNRMSSNYPEAQKYYLKYWESYKTNIDGNLSYEELIESRINYPKTNNNVDQSIELKELNLPNVQQGMGYTFLENGDLICGIQQEDKENKTTFTTLETFSASSNFQQIEKINLNTKTSFFNAYPSYSSTSKILYFTGNLIDKKKSFKDKKNVIQIYSINTKESKGEAQLLSFNKPQYNYTHPAISDDGKRLYFVSDIPGGYGGYDVYYVEKVDNGWSEIKNCGPNVNTQFDELTPFVIGDSLFFSSYGHGNYGGSDIFLSIKEAEEYSKAYNLGLPINSSKNDFSFIMTPEKGMAIITSDRNYSQSKKDEVYQVIFPQVSNLVYDESTNELIPGVTVKINDGAEIHSNESGEWSKRINEGENVTLEFIHPKYETKTIAYTNITKEQIDDIRNVTLTPIIIGGKFVNDITGKPVDGVVVTIDEKDGEEWKFIGVQESDEEGKWGFNVRKDKEYKISQEKEDYISNEIIAPRYDGSKEEREEVLSKINPYALKYDAKKDLVIQIENIYFDFNSSIVKTESYPILEKVKNFMNENPDIKIELSAHTDCMGEDKYNLWLSDRRAKTSKEYLVKAGISAGRIIAKGYGEQKMIVTDCELQKKDDTQAQKNRRVEVKVL